MGMEAQRIIDVMRQAVSQMTRNGAMRQYVLGQVAVGGAYQVSAYLNGSESLSDYIDVPAGLHVSAGSYVEVVHTDEDMIVHRVLPTLFARLAIDPETGQVYTGDGSTEPSDPGSGGYVLTSGGSGASAYWAASAGGGGGSSLSLSTSTPSAVSTAGAAGSSAYASKGDHTHAHEDAHINHDTTWAAKGDLIVGTANDTAQVLTVGSNDTIPMADSGQTTGIKWVPSQTPSTQAFGDSAAEGTADTYSRGDHKHAMPSLTAPTVNLYTSGSGTWTKPAGALYVVVEVQGGGGSAGGTGATSSNQGAASSGGGGGGFTKKTFAASDLPSSCSYAVGAGGSATSAGNNNGNNGSASSFSGSGITTMSGGGGSGGTGNASTSGSQGSAGGAGGTSSGGDLNIDGQGGGRGRVSSGAPTGYDPGGSSHLGLGGSAGANASGDAGSGYGGGGGPAVMGASQSATAGAAGSSGVIVVTTYYQ